MIPWVTEKFFVDNFVDPPPEKFFDETRQQIFDKDVPSHCRVQYYFDQESDSVKRILVCRDKDGAERVYYGK